MLVRGHSFLRPASRYLKRNLFLISAQTSSMSASAAGMDLSRVVAALEHFAPCRLAESWDNVGLLLEPSPPHHVRNILLTNDLTEDVLDEAVRRDAQLVLSYHPPIFNALKRITNLTWKERIIARCSERRIAIYSPHTCWDAVAGGVNDWLAGAFETKSVRPITSGSGFPRDHSHCVTLDAPPDVMKNWDNAIIWDQLVTLLKNSPDAAIKTNDQDVGEASGGQNVRLVFTCKEFILTNLSELLTKSSLLEDLRITKLEKLPSTSTGMGRSCILVEPLPLAAIVQIIKDHLHLSHLRVAVGRGRSMEDASVSEVALCAGAGASVLRHAASADLYWTGEMSHHEVLDATQRGVSVVLCEHSNTERGFLHHIAPSLEQMMDENTGVFVSETDADPLTVI